MLIIGNVIMFIVFLCLVIFLQIFLSKAENKWLGLILPFLSFLYSLLLAMNVLEGPGALATMIAAFLVGNVPTIILIGIYLACRQSRKKKKQMDKTKIQDL